jgi:hypothetical protein
MLWARIGDEVVEGVGEAAEADEVGGDGLWLLGEVRKEDESVGREEAIEVRLEAREGEGGAAIQASPRGIEFKVQGSTFRVRASRPVTLSVEP